MTDYKNTETRIYGGGKKVVRKVSIKNGKGYKRVLSYRRGKKVSDVKMPISPEHIQKIQSGEFIAGLFQDCKRDACNSKTRTRKIRKD